MVLSASPFKIPGCCSLCDEPAFEIKAVWDDGAHKGEPKAIGQPNDGTVHVSFLLLSGGFTDMTFCANCAGTLSPEHYTLLWRKNLAGYMRGTNGDPTKFSKEFSNALLCELGRKEVSKSQRGNILG